MITELVKELITHAHIHTHTHNTRLTNRMPRSTNRMPRRTYIPPPEPFRRLEIPDFVKDVLNRPEAAAFCESFRAMLPPPPSPEELAVQAATARLAHWPLRPLPPPPRPRPPLPQPPREPKELSHAKNDAARAALLKRKLH